MPTQVSVMVSVVRVQASGSLGLHSSLRRNLLCEAQQDLMGTAKHEGRRSNRFPIIDGSDHEIGP